MAAAIGKSLALHEYSRGVTRQALVHRLRRRHQRYLWKTGAGAESDFKPHGFSVFPFGLFVFPRENKLESDYVGMKLGRICVLPVLHLVLFYFRFLCFLRLNGAPELGN